MNSYLLAIALPILVLFSSARGIRRVARGKSVLARQSVAASLCMLFVASVLAFAALTGCGGNSTLSGQGGSGGTPATKVAAPSFTPAGGIYTRAERVTIDDSTRGATIHYTTDGTTPTAQSAVYSGPINVTAHKLIQAMAVKAGGATSVVNSAAYVISPETAGAQTVEQCTNGVLPPGNTDTDLEIEGGDCVVDGKAPKGTYIYRNVNIWGKGTLTFDDAKIDFHAHSVLVENGGTLSAGASKPVVGPITIWLYGSKDDGIPEITCKSSPTCGVPADIWASNPNLITHVKPGPTDKCTPASKFGPSPVGDGCFYQYNVLDTGGPAGAFFGKKALALSYGGTLYLRGAKGIRPGPIAEKPSDSGTSWVRLTDTLKGREISFHVDRPVPTWGYGDHIVLTSTDYLPGHSEEKVIQSVASDQTGTLITLQSPVEFPHNGATYDFSSLPSTSGPKDDPNRPTTLPSRHLETRAAVALLTRSIMIASESAKPVPGDRSVDHFSAPNYYGGHTIMRDGFATYQVQGVEFYHLGQGGVIGRYPVHFHMDREVPQPTVDPPFAGT
ncbi:MAG: chitobiase/beta-hexosaminidase C-terminal domain-containing protein, partial [Caldimonas sp.]